MGAGVAGGDPVLQDVGVETGAEIRDITIDGDVGITSRTHAQRL